jgi:hypothetical protein
MQRVVSKVHVTASQDKVPPVYPRLVQSKPLRSTPSHCSPASMVPFPQPPPPVVLGSVVELLVLGVVVLPVVLVVEAAVVAPALLEDALSDEPVVADALPETLELPDPPVTSVSPAVAVTVTDAPVGPNPG